MQNFMNNSQEIVQNYTDDDGNPVGQQMLGYLSSMFKNMGNMPNMDNSENATK